MFIKNGIVYGGEPDIMLKVDSFKMLPDKILLITFSNGETRLFDGTILNDGVFKRLENEDVFRDARLDHGVITWMDGEIDCSPEFMYNNSYEYPILEEKETSEWDYTTVEASDETKLMTFSL